MSFIQDTALLDSANSVVNQSVAIAAPVQDQNLIELLMKGGWIMIPIVVLFFIGLVIFIERYITIRNASKSDGNLMAQIKSNVLSGKLDSAIAVCRSSNSALARIDRKS